MALLLPFPSVTLYQKMMQLSGVVQWQRALGQLVNETVWPELITLLSTCHRHGDIQLTLSQQIPVTGAVVVDNTSRFGCADARKGVAMFDKSERASCRLSGKHELPYL